MSDVLELNEQAVLPFGTVKRAAGGGVLVESAAGTSTVVDPDLEDGDELMVRSFPHWLVAVGERSSRVLAWEVADPRIRVVGSVGRLELTGYDPGGLSRTSLFAVDDDRCLIETEVGLAVAARLEGVTWSQIHHDLTARVQEVRDGVVYVESETDRSRLSVDSGAYLGGEPVS